VTELAGLSVFSGLNNIKHLTLKDKFADICGYTQKELEENFSEHIDALAKKENVSREAMLAKIKHWYDGYTWDGKTEMYNPFSTLNVFDDKKFGMYWFASGPPNYLISYIKQAKKLNLFFDEQTASETKLMTFNPAITTATALLFQTGYLTIKGKIDKSNDEVDYLIDSPNLEVRKSLAKHVLLSFGDEINDEEIVGLKPQLLKAAIDEDAKTFADTVSAVLTRIPYTINETKNENKDEGGESFYHAMLTCIMIAMDFDVASEYITNLGRIDLVWKYENKVFIIEMKFVDRTDKAQEAIDKEMDEKVEAALSQIKDRKYYERYALAKNEVILVGLVVSTKAKDVKARFERI
jgi:Holliday junction resolvase-like predicted endonuclease